MTEVFEVTKMRQGAEGAEASLSNILNECLLSAMLSLTTVMTEIKLTIITVELDRGE